MKFSHSMSVGVVDDGNGDDVDDNVKVAIKLERQIFTTARRSSSSEVARSIRMMLMNVGHCCPFSSLHSVDIFVNLLEFQPIYSSILPRMSRCHAILAESFWLILYIDSIQWTFPNRISSFLTNDGLWRVGNRTLNNSSIDSQANIENSSHELNYFDSTPKEILEDAMLLYLYERKCIVWYKICASSKRAEENRGEYGDSKYLSLYEYECI